MITLFTFIQYSKSIYNCTLINSTDPTICDQCNSGYRLTTSQTKCGPDVVVNCSFLSDGSVQYGYRLVNTSYDYIPITSGTIVNNNTWN